MRRRRASRRSVARRSHARTAARRGRRRSTGTQQCANCGQIVDNGRFDWVVEQVRSSSLDERPPTLTTEVPERGTDLPTYAQPRRRRAVRRAPAARSRGRAARARARLKLIYAALTAAWAQNELAPVRGFVSDGLFDYSSYWVDAYKRQGLRNELVDMRITRSSSRRSRAIAGTTRSRSACGRTGKDYVVRGDEQSCAARSGNDRPYSEYWTLIRSAGRKGATKTERDLRQLRRAAGGHDGGRLQLLRRPRHRRRVRLGALEDRARRLVSRLNVASVTPLPEPLPDEDLSVYRTT